MTMRRATVAGWVVGVATAAAAAMAQATTVLVMSLEQGRAQLLVNGTAVRTLRAGQTSLEGVRLVSADRTKAVLEVDGRQLALGLGGSTVATAEIKADRWGMYATTAYVNGFPTAAVIDTGAFAVSVTRWEADRMGIRYAGAPRIETSTAGGVRHGYRVKFATVRVGDITVHNVDGVVVESQPGDDRNTLIGVSFLNAVEMRRSGDTLTLIRRNF
jgi:aspartyl protease family protein